MNKLERFVLNLPPIKLLVHKSQQVILPGFQGLPLYDVIVFFIRQVKKVGLSERASSIAFNFLMAIPAAVIFLCTLLPYIPISKKMTTQLLLLANDFIRDHDAYLAVKKFLIDFLDTPRSGLLSLGFFLAVLYASNAMLGIMRTFNKSLVRSSRRNYFESRWMAIKLTTLVIVLIIVSLILSIIQGAVFNSLLTWMNINKPFIKTLIGSLRYVVIVALIYYTIAFIYKYAPAVKERWHLSSPGTILATFLTIFTTFMFSFWVNRFANYNKVYGSIGTILIIMLLTYINAFILLIGFELNVSIHSIKLAAKERQHQKK
jgi:membrane protein